MKWKVVAVVIVVLIIVISAIGIVMWQSPPPKGGPSPAPGEQPVTVRGKVAFDTGNPVSGAKLSVSIRENSTPAAESTTAADGSFQLGINPGALPARVRIDVAYESAGMPQISSARWMVANSSLLEAGTIVLPNPAGAKLKVAGTSASSADGSVRLSGLPPSVSSVYAKAFNPATDRDAFPGEFAEMAGPVGLESTVFLWAEALDASGNAVTEFGKALTIRVRVPPTQWPTLVDVSPRTGRIEAPMYSYDENRNAWAQERELGWLVNAYGTVLPESTLGSLLSGTYSGAVFVVFRTQHLSWVNLDYPFYGPWTLSYLDSSLRQSATTLEALQLAEAIFRTSWANKAYSAVNQKNVNLAQEFPDGAGPEIATFEGGTPYGKYKYDPKETDKIFVNKDLWERGDTKSQETAFMLAVTILHETAHWKHHQIRNQGKYYAEGYDVGGEAGYHIEEKLFGETIWWDDLETKDHLVTGDKRTVTQSQLDKLSDPDWWTTNDASFSQQFWEEFWGSGRATEASSPVNLEVTVPQQSYCLDESISIDVEYSNPGSTEIRVLGPVHPYGYPLYFEILGPDGNPVQVIGPVPKFQVPGEHFLSLPPGGSLKFSVNLSSSSYFGGGGFVFNQGGDHKVTVHYSSHFGPEGKSNTATLHIASGQVGGTVLAAATGGPLSGSLVIARLWGLTIASASAGPDGKYAFQNLPAGGNLSFTAMALGYLSRARDMVTVNPGQPTDLDFELEPFSSRFSPKGGQFDDGGLVLNLSVSGDLVYAAAGSEGLKILNVSTPSEPRMVSQIITPLGPGPADYVAKVITDGSRAYLLTDSKGLVILDVSNLSNVRELSRIKVGDWKERADMVSRGSYVYFSNGTSLMIIDVSNPNLPVVRGEYVYHSDTSILLQISTGFDVQGDYAYLPNVTNVAIVDVRDPAAPKLAGRIETFAAVSVAVDGGYAYINRITLAANFMEVADVRDPSNTSIIGKLICHSSFDFGGADIAVKDNRLFLSAGGMGLEVIDISDPRNPMMVNRYDEGGVILDFAFYGCLTVLANDRSGLDIIQPALPGLLKIGNFSDGGSARAVVVEGPCAFVADYNDGLEILDISDPGSIHELGQFTEPEDSNAIGVAVAGGYAYVITEMGDLQIINVSNKSQPVLEGNINCGEEALAIAVKGPHAFVLDYIVSSHPYVSTYRLDVIDVSNPGSPGLLGRLNISNNPVDDMTFDGRCLYFVDRNESSGDCDLIIVDVSDAAAPKRVSTFLIYTNWLGMSFQEHIAVSGTLLITSSGFVIDVTYPAAPVIYGRDQSVSLGWIGNDFAVEDTLFYGFSWNGLCVLDASDPGSPRLVGGFSDKRAPAYIDDPAGIAISGKLVFLADGKEGLKIVQLG